MIARAERAQRRRVQVLERAKDGAVAQGEHTILLVGKRSPLLEGVCELLQLAGYRVGLSTTWAEAERAMRESQPDLAVLDLSDWMDSLQLPQALRVMTPPVDVPILLLSFTGDERIWHLQHVSDARQDGRVQVYAHSLLGPSALLEKVAGCLR